MKKVSSKRKSSVPSIKNDDFKNALLIVSLLINVFVLTTWLVAKLSPTLAAQLGQLVN